MRTTPQTVRMIPHLWLFAVSDKAVPISLPFSISESPSNAPGNKTKSKSINQLLVSKKTCITPWSKSTVLTAQPCGHHYCFCSDHHSLGNERGLQDIHNPFPLFKLTNVWSCFVDQRKTFLTLKTPSLQTLAREAFMCGSPAAKASPRRHSPPSSDPQYPTLLRHFVQPSATGDITEERCAVFLLYKCYPHSF